MRHPMLRILCEDPKVDIKLEMGDGPATPTAGAAAWETVALENGTAITTRSSSSPFQQDVPVLLDGYAERRSVQRQLDALLSLGGEDAAVFKVFGPIHRPGIRYVLGGEPEFGETIRDNDGTLLRQRLTLKLMQYVPGRGPRVRKRRGRRGKRGLGNARALTYTVSQRETLARITVKLLGDWKRWREIGDKNDIRDPHRLLEPGRVLKL